MWVHCIIELMLKFTHISRNSISLLNTTTTFYDTLSTHSRVCPLQSVQTQAVSHLSLHQSVLSPVVSRPRTRVFQIGQHHNQAGCHRHNLLNNPRLHQCHPHSLVLSHPLRCVFIFISANTKVVIYISYISLLYKNTTSHHYSIAAIGESISIIFP